MTAKLELTLMPMIPQVLNLSGRCIVLIWKWVLTENIKVNVYWNYISVHVLLCILLRDDLWLQLVWCFNLFCLKYTSFITNVQFCFLFSWCCGPDKWLIHVYGDWGPNFFHKFGFHVWFGGRTQCWEYSWNIFTNNQEFFKAWP